MEWQVLKGELSQLTVAMDALHIYAAVVIQLVACLVFRRPMSHIAPWLAVLAAELLNEGADILLGREARIQEWQIAGAVHDLVNTMALPTLLLLAVRRGPCFLWRTASRPAASSGLPEAGVASRESGVSCADSRCR